MFSFEMQHLGIIDKITKKEKLWVLHFRISQKMNVLH